MELRYCDTCGFRIAEADLIGGKVQETAGKYLCSKCAPHPAAAESPKPGAATGKSPARGSQALIPLKISGSHKAPSGVIRKPSPAASEAKNNNWWIPAAGGGAVFVLGLVLHLGGGEKSSNSASAPQRKEAPAAMDTGNPVGTPNVKGAATPRQDPVEKAPAYVPTGPLVVPRHNDDPQIVDVQKIKTVDAQEDAAQRAFDGLAQSDEAAKRIAALEAFIAKYDGAIVVARARTQVAALKAAQPAPDNDPAEKSPPPKIAAGNPQTPPAPPEPPAARPVDPGVNASAGAEALSAYGAFSDHYWSSLSKRETAAAFKALALALDDPALKVMAAELGEDRSALKLFDAFEQSALKGVQKLSELDFFELQRTRGGPIKVGKRGEFKVTGVKDGVVTLESKGLSVTVTLDALSLETWSKLAELDNDKGEVARGLLPIFARVLQSGESVDVAKIRTQLQGLDAKLSQCDELGCLSRRLARLENLRGESQSQAAEAAFNRMLKAADAKDRATLATAVGNFKRNFGGTDFAAKKAGVVKMLEAKLTPPIVTDGLVAYYPLDESAGTAAPDGSGAGHDGKVVNAAWAPGIIGGALKFTKPDSYVVFSGVAFNPTSISLCAWVKHQGNAAEYERYITEGSDTAILRRHRDGHLEFVLRINGKLEFLVSPDLMPTGRWSHTAATWDGKVWRLYLDGAQVASGARTGKLDSHTDGAISLNSVEAMDGLLDEIRIYNRALSDAEIRQLAEQKPAKDDK